MDRTKGKLVCHSGAIYTDSGVISDLHERPIAHLRRALNQKG